LLRAVAIIISKSLNADAERLGSNALNIISAILMIKRFNAVSEEGESKDTPGIDTIINDIFHHYGTMETHVKLNEENIANATTVFHETIPIMNCNPLIGGRTRKPRKPMKPRKPRKQRKSKRTRKLH
jgi:hypothetical protein